MFRFLPGTCTLNVENSREGSIPLRSEDSDVIHKTWSIVEARGRRKYMEDRAQVRVLHAKNEEKTPILSWLAIFDGHGGDLASDLCDKHMFDMFKDRLFSQDMEGDMYTTQQIEAVLEDTYHNMDNELQKKTVRMSGSTGTTVIVTHTHIIFGFIGDSCAMLVRDAKVYYSTRMHNVDEHDERQRVKATRARIKHGMVFHHERERALGMTRAFGNFDLKDEADLPKHKQAVISVPEIKSIEREDKDDYLCLASDGLWNYMKHPHVHKHLHRNRSRSASEKVMKLAGKAQAAGSTDNISILILEF